MFFDEDNENYCDVCDKSIKNCRCDVGEEEENSMFNPNEEEEKNYKDLSSM